MMNRSLNPRDHPETFQIKQDGKFFSRLLSREGSVANTSSRLPYYGGAARSVPFTWESQPGTPKHVFSDASLRPLTPPPSISTPVLTGSSSSSQGRHRKRNLSMSAAFSRFTSKRSHRASPSSSVSSGSTSSSSWSSYNSSPSTSRFRIHRHFFSCSGSSMLYDNEEIGDEKEDGYGSPDLTLSFGERRTYSDKFRGCYSMGNVKKRFLSILGQRQGTY